MPKATVTVHHAAAPVNVLRARLEALKAGIEKLRLELNIEPLFPTFIVVSDLPPVRAICPFGSGMVGLGDPMYDIDNIAPFSDREDAEAFVKRWNAENGHDPVKVVTRHEFRPVLLSHYQEQLTALQRRINVIEFPVRLAVAHVGIASA